MNGEQGNIPMLHGSDEAIQGEEFDRESAHILQRKTGDV